MSHVRLLVLLQCFASNMAAHYAFAVNHASQVAPMCP